MEPKDLLEGHNSEDLYIQLRCGGGRLSKRGKRMFKAKYVFDCVKKGRLLPNLREYLCKQYIKQENKDTSKNTNNDTRDPLQVGFSPLLEYWFSSIPHTVLVQAVLGLGAGEHKQK